MMRSSGRQGFHDDGHSLSPADAGGAQAVPTTAAAQGVEQMGGDAATAGAERMPERHGASVDIGALAVEAELPFDRQVLCRERLVDLYQVHVLEREPRVGQRVA